MCRPSRPNYNQHHQSIFVNRHISHAIQRFSRQTTSQKAIPGQGTPLKLPSNLEPILSKLLERVVLSRLKGYLTSNNLLNPNQSAYTKHHSTETLPTSLYNKFVMAIGHQQVSCLCLLDISAAFDTIDHTMLTHRLSSLFEISETALYHGSSRTSPHALSLSMLLVTHLIRKPSPVVFLKVLFSAPFCSFFTPPHSAN